MPAAPVASAFDPSDWAKMVVITGATIALCLIAKRLGGGDSSVPSLDLRSEATHPGRDCSLDATTTEALMVSRTLTLLAGAPIIELADGHLRTDR